MKDKKRGIFFIILAGFFFALMSFFVKLSGDVPTMQKAFFRNIIAVIVASLMILRSDQKFHVHAGCWPDLLLRSAFGTAGLIANFYAISHMALADANILNKLSPFFAIIMSYFLLKEKANKVEWLSVFVAFIGALFVVKPSFQMSTFYALIGVLGGFTAGTAYTFVRRLGMKGERSEVIVFAFSAFSSLIILPFMLLNFKPMTFVQLGTLLLAGLCASGGQFAITKAYTLAPAKEISVYDYTQVIFAAMLGLLIGQIPDLLSFVGYVIIIGAAVFKTRYNLRFEEKGA